MGASAGAVGALAGPREELILSAQGEVGQVTAAVSDAWLVRGLTLTAEGSGRAEGAGAVVKGAEPRYLRGSSTQGGAEGGTAPAEGTREEAIPMQARAVVAGRGNANFFVGTTEGGLQIKKSI